MVVNLNLTNNLVNKNTQYIMLNSELQTDGYLTNINIKTVQNGTINLTVFPRFYKNIL